MRGKRTGCETREASGGSRAVKLHLGAPESRRRRSHANGSPVRQVGLLLSLRGEWASESPSRGLPTGSVEEDGGRAAGGGRRFSRGMGQNATVEKSLLTTREVAERLSVRILTVRFLAAQGALPTVRFTPTSRMRFRSDDVESFVESRRRHEEATR